MIHGKKEVIKVGGIVELTINEIYQGSNVKMKALHELCSYLHCFLISTVYPGKPKHVLSVLKKILIHATLHPNIIIFTFPDDIKTQFRLYHSLTMPLTVGAGFTLYRSQLLTQAKLACEIQVDTNLKDKKNVMLEIQDSLQKSKSHINRIKIAIDKKNGEYVGIIILPDNKIRVTGVTLQDVLTLIRQNI